MLRDLDGAVVGHLAAIVEHFWSPFSPLTWQECVWLLVTWTDGEGEPIIEDYPPWTAVDEVRMGQIEVERMSTGISGTFSVEWLEGSERDAAWTRCGIKEPAGYYLGGYHL
ncbi:hypothetical protein SAMN04489747_1444 [Auraticoccus monumenti]|uniref:Uncharacterized protein n=1 Tax=Auraticoccus monumenti TaxID=675864 RepID=A0A1G6WHI5_9ACTN|nr:hypothetical protein SAMN04489747_1444 [Auraticoccus monumenti]